MIKYIYVPRDITNASTHVEAIAIEQGSRIRRDMLLIKLKAQGHTIAINSLYNGWVKQVAVNEGDVVEAGSLLFIVDIVEDNDYQVDAGEFSNETELGKQGRRGLEREGQRQYAQGYSAELFDAPEKGTGMGHRGAVEQHPLTKNMKEGVPAKMSGNPEQNNVAVDQAIEEASSNPDLQKQFSKQLQAQLNIQSTPSNAPTLNAR